MSVPTVKQAKAEFWDEVREAIRNENKARLIELANLLAEVDLEGAEKILQEAKKLA